MHCSSRRPTYIFLACNASSPTASQGILSLYNTLGVKKPPAVSTEPVRAPGPLDPTTLPETEPSRAGLRIVRAILNTGWPALYATLSFLLNTNLSDSIFDDVRVIGALQTLARAVCLALPIPRDGSSLPSQKPHSHHASSPRSMNPNNFPLPCAPRLT